MAEWIPKEDFARTEYGRLNEDLGSGSFYGPLDKAKLPENATIVPDPKDGLYGIIKDIGGNPLGKVRLDE